MRRQRRYAHADRCSSAGAVHAPANDPSMLSPGMLQEIAQLTQMFPSVPASVIAGALGRAGGDVQLAADALLSVGQVKPRPHAPSCVQFDSRSVQYLGLSGVLVYFRP